MNKKIKRIICILLFFILLFFIFYKKTILLFKPSYKSIEKIYEVNKNELYFINNYILNLNYEKIYINNSTGIMFTGLKNGDVMINNKDVIRSIKFLFDTERFELIEKNKNTICYQIWSNLDNGCGVLYSIDGKKPELPFVVKLEPLQNKNWYYYEEGFNEWTTDNQ